MQNTRKPNVYIKLQTIAKQVITRMSVLIMRYLSQLSEKYPILMCPYELTNIYVRYVNNTIRIASTAPAYAGYLLNMGETNIKLLATHWMAYAIDAFNADHRNIIKIKQETSSTIIECINERY